MDEKSLVIVTWHDAWADQDNFASAHGMAQTHEPMVVHTLGWIVHDDDKGLSVVNEMSNEDGKAIYRGRTFIPRAMVQKVTPYQLSKPRATRKAKETTNEVP